MLMAYTVFILAKKCSLVPFKFFDNIIVHTKQTPIFYAKNDENFSNLSMMSLLDIIPSVEEKKRKEN